MEKIRFKGFTAEWESKKLKELFILSGSGGTPLSTNKEYYNGNIPFLSISDISNSDGKIYKTEKYITEQGLENSSAWIVPSESITLAMYASVGKVAINKVPLATSQAFYNMYFDDLNLRDFIFQRLKHMEKNNGWTNLISTGTQANLNADKVKNLDICIPRDKKEQEKIGGFLSAFDKLIEKQKEKVGLLSYYKKNIMQMIFPNSNENTPKNRFIGYDSPWNITKVGKIYYFKNGINKEKEFFGSGTPIVNFTDVFKNREIKKGKLKGLITVSQQEKENFNVIKGDIFFTRTSEVLEEIGYPSVAIDDMDDTIFSGFVLRGRCYLEKDPLEDTFKKYVFFTDQFRQEMIKKSSMTTRALTSGTAISDMIFKYPTNLNEQYKIGRLLTIIDSLIELNSRKINTFQLLKKGYMQRIFAD